jgi:5-(carboxyamino)imidazole ribonucleotide synthase
MSNALIAPGATLGVMGGGQLGRMFVHAAQALGYGTAVLDPDPSSPAGQVAHHHVHSDYLDLQGLMRLADLSAAVTVEFENVPAQALEKLGRTVLLAPRADAVAIAQDRAAEKALFARCAIACAPYTAISNAEQLGRVPDTLLPGILKTAQLGYDGKGQLRVDARTDLAPAWERLQRVPCVLEQRLAIATELSVIVARNAAGAIVHFPVQRNLHRDGILALTQVPADAGDPLASEAIEATKRIAVELDYVGVLCVEFFVRDDGALLANELAPRPHNSGHYTIDACDQSQFELQVRAMTGLPLVAPRLHSPAVMLNLLGDLWFGAGDKPVEPPWQQVLELPGMHLHLYGKAQPRRGRKMGHLTVTAADAETARANARLAAQRLGIAPF